MGKGKTLEEVPARCLVWLTVPDLGTAPAARASSYRPLLRHLLQWRQTDPISAGIHPFPPRSPMDANRLDGLLRTLAQTQSRRHTVRLVAGGVLGSLLGVGLVKTPATANGNGKGKGKKALMCGGCVDLLTNPQHCGRCDVTCSGGTPACAHGNFAPWLWMDASVHLRGGPATP